MIGSGNVNYWSTSKSKNFAVKINRYSLKMMAKHDHIFLANVMTSNLSEKLLSIGL